MKRYLIFLFFLFVAHSFYLSAQQKGTFIIEEDPAITALLGKPLEYGGKENADVIKMNGFRIRIFMGSNQKTAREEALEKQALLNEVFPELATYLNYDAPNWKLYAGDFLTKEEAMVFRQRIQKSFPQFGREIYTVSDKVNIPIHKAE